MKKILFYLNTIGHGGAERVMSNLSAHFSQKYECIFVTSMEISNEYVLNSEVKRINLADTEISGFIKKNCYLTRKLRNVIKKEKPDIVISFMAEPNFRALVACAGLKTKNLISVRNDPDKEYPSFVYRNLAKILYRFSDGVVFQTEQAKVWFPKSVQKRSRIILNQVNASFYSQNYEGDHHNIVTLGRLMPQKNHKLLIKAFSDIADQVDDNLIIYGEGDQRSELQALIDELGLNERISLPGVINNVAEATRDAKVFVLSSDYEGMPNALMEALALGIPCISTDCPCGGPRALINDGENGILIPVGDAAALSDALKKILEDADYASKLSKCAKVRAQEFSPERIFACWEDYMLLTVGEIQNQRRN